MTSFYDASTKSGLRQSEALPSSKDDSFIAATLVGYKTLDMCADGFRSPSRPGFLWKTGWNRFDRLASFSEANDAGLYAHHSFVGGYSRSWDGVETIVEGKGHIVSGDEAFRSEYMRIKAVSIPECPQRLTSLLGYGNSACFAFLSSSLIVLLFLYLYLYALSVDWAMFILFLDMIPLCIGFALLCERVPLMKHKEAKHKQKAAILWMEKHYPEVEIFVGATALAASLGGKPSKAAKRSERGFYAKTEKVCE